MTARQSYHLTFARFSPSLSVKSFTASEAANTAYRVEITATSTDSSLPLSSYLNQRAAFEIRPQEAVLSEVAAAFAAGSDESPAKQWQGIITSCEKLSVSKSARLLPPPCRAGKRRYRSTLQPQHPSQPHRRRHTQCRLQLPHCRYRPLCRNRQQTVRRICRQHRLIGQTTTLGPPSQNPRRSQSSDDPVERSRPLPPNRRQRQR